MRFLFRLRLHDEALPRLLVKFTSGSWNTTANFLGFWEYWESAARELGVQNPTYFGLPFTLTLTEQTQPSQKRRFPVVIIAPELDPIDFFRQQAEYRQQIESSAPAAALTDQSEKDSEEVYRDLKGITVPTSPQDAKQHRSQSRP